MLKQMEPFELVKSIIFFKQKHTHTNTQNRLLFVHVRTCILRLFCRRWQMNDAAGSFAKAVGEGQCQNADMKQQMEQNAPRG